MDMQALFSDWGAAYDWVILPLFIFLARICDQTIGTLRVVYIAKGHKNIAPLMGFFETLIWILVVRQIFSDIANPLCYVAYAAGFATGNYIGLILEERLSLGSVIVRVIMPLEDPQFLKALRDHNYGYTIVDAEGSNGKVKIVFAVLNRTNLPDFIGLLKRENPSAFYTIEDIKQVKDGIFPNRNRRSFMGITRHK